MSWEINETIGGLSIGKFNKTITGLDIYSDYEFKAFIVVDGDYYYGETLTATTMPIQYEPVVETLVSTDVSYNDMKLNGRITDLGYSDIIEYGVLYKIGDNTNIDFDSGGIPKAGVNTIIVTGDSITVPYPFSFDVLLLPEDTMIYHRAYAKNYVGYSLGDVIGTMTLSIYGVYGNATTQAIGVGNLL